ncbi:MAG TPA: hypothetical protein VIP56_08895, partial [Nitrososphaeraceae archaeon]
IGQIGNILPSLLKKSDSFEARRRISGPLFVPLRFAWDFDSSGTPIKTILASAIVSAVER